MIYIIKGKPYIKVSNYYKEISIDKKGNEYIAKPVGGKETRITDINSNEIIGTSISEYYINKNKNSFDKGSEKGNIIMNNNKIY